MKTELKPCPFCGGKPKIMARQRKFIGINCFGNKKLVWTIYIKCNSCHSRGKPIKTEPIKMYDEEHGNIGVGNFYYTEFWRGSGSGLMTATLNFEPYVKQAIEAWNRRAAKTPCDLCKFNPPSSMDGKPCTMCVADGMAEDGK